MRPLVIGFAGLIVLGGWGVAVSVVKQFEGDAEPRLVLVTGGTGPFWQRAAAGARVEAQRKHVRLDIEMPGADVAAQQRFMLKQLEADSPEAVAVCPTAKDGQRPVLESLSRRCRTMTFLKGLDPSPCLLHVGVCDYTTGKRAGQAVVELLPAGGTILLIGTDAADVGEQERRAGILEAFSHLGGVSAGGNRGRWNVESLAVDARDKRRAGEAVREAESRRAIGACVVLKNDWTISAGDAGKLGAARPCPVITFGQTFELLDCVRSGSVYATIGVDPYEVGRITVNAEATLVRQSRLGLPTRGVGRLGLPLRLIRRGDLDPAAKESGFNDLCMEGP